MERDMTGEKSDYAANSYERFKNDENPDYAKIAKILVGYWPRRYAVVLADVTTKRWEGEAYNVLLDAAAIVAAESHISSEKFVHDILEAQARIPDDKATERH
jgi:hypothetical protein